jgi:hypothetical protein
MAGTQRAGGDGGDGAFLVSYTPRNIFRRLGSMDGISGTGPFFNDPLSAKKKH